MKGCAILAAILLPVLHITAQQPSFDIQTTDGQTTFHIGEPIVLNLTIATAVDGAYVAAPWATPRGGEFDLDTVAVSPATGWSDPLALYFKQRMIRTGHGWQWPPLEQAKPVHLALMLNQWVRFDEPGDYTVTITTHRISGATTNKNPPIPSASVKLHIIAATPEWQSARLAEIRSKVAVDDPLKMDTAALRALKYLGTPDAIDLLTRLMRNIGWYVESEASNALDCVSDAMRPVAIQAMERRIAEPDFPVSLQFFTTFEFLEVKPGSDTDSIYAQTAAGRAALWNKVFASLPAKDAHARAQTVQTLLFFGRNIKTPETQARMNSLLSASFLDLDMRSQIDDLRQHWDMLRAPTFLPTLRKLAETPFTNDEATSPYSTTDLRAAAFRRWYDLDPAGGREEALRQIGTGSPTMPAQAVAFLPDKSLPKFEPIWAKAFVDTTDQLTIRRLGSLLIHFGTGTATPQMIAKLDAPVNTYSCDGHVYALAYLARFSAAEAGPRLRHEIASDEAHCDGGLFGWISEQTAAPILNDVAVENLNNANEEMLRGAIQYLTAYGRPEDRAPIVQRFAKWTPDWKNYPDYFRKPLDGPPADPGNLIVGEELARAVIANQGWLADKALIDSVVARCAGEVMCNSLRGMQYWSQTPYQVSLPDTSEPLGFAYPFGFGIAQYGPRTFELLDAKLQQFPRGTTFVLRSTPFDDNSDKQKIEAKVRELFQRRGMVLLGPEQNPLIPHRSSIPPKQSLDGAPH
jgi:hypothetical protein